MWVQLLLLLLFFFFYNFISNVFAEQLQILAEATTKLRDSVYKISVFHLSAKGGSTKNTVVSGLWIFWYTTNSKVILHHYRYQLQFLVVSNVNCPPRWAGKCFSCLSNAGVNPDT